MPKEAGRLISLIAAMVLVVAGHGLCGPFMPGPNRMSFDRIVRHYGQEGPNRWRDSCEVDVWALWEDLAIPPRTMKEPATIHWANLWDAVRYGRFNVISPGRPLKGARAQKTDQILPTRETTTTESAKQS